ncbi:uncharacterized protein LOC109285119 [Alligator mississippiensis]|uniref:uncharacterized protein LOC109285119 n=1 Tax=Alligator mississippiensis TaxID=8496 RepID=UPI002877FFD6|nr:uncharacterized protein LOC109285119 [Alligator mississippiensis]
MEHSMGGSPVPESVMRVSSAAATLLGTWAAAWPDASPTGLRLASSHRRETLSAFPLASSVCTLWQAGATAIPSPGTWASAHPLLLALQLPAGAASTPGLQIEAGDVMQGWRADGGTEKSLMGRANTRPCLQTPARRRHSCHFKGTGPRSQQQGPGQRPPGTVSRTLDRALLKSSLSVPVPICRGAHGTFCKLRPSPGCSPVRPHPRGDGATILRPASAAAGTGSSAKGLRMLPAHGASACRRSAHNDARSSCSCSRRCASRLSFAAPQPLTVAGAGGGFQTAPEQQNGCSHKAPTGHVPLRVTCSTQAAPGIKSEETPADEMQAQTSQHEGPKFSKMVSLLRRPCIYVRERVRPPGVDTTHFSSAHQRSPASCITDSRERGQRGPLEVQPLTQGRASPR